MSRKRYLIIGDGAAGVTAAEKLRRLDPSAMIGLFTDEPKPHYYRAALTNYFLGELREDQLFAVPPDFYEALGIRRVFARITGVDPARKMVWDTSSRTPTEYDGLLLATGAEPRQPAFDGAHLPGVMTLRTLADVQRVRDWLRMRSVKRAVVLGGGPLGLEWAHGLQEHGVRVTLIERSQRFMRNALDEVASDLLATRLRHGGIEVVLGDEAVAALPDAAGAVAGVRLRSGAELPCQLIAAALGVVANSAFLGPSGIALAENGGVQVNRRMQSSQPGIWAAGDVANVEGEQLQLWEPARTQGAIAAQNMVGRTAEYRRGAFYFATRLFDLDFARVGSLERATGNEEVVDFPRGTGTITYRRLVLRDGKLIGAIMIGERAARVRAAGRAFKQLIDSGLDVRAIRHELLNPGFDFNGWLQTSKLLQKPEAPPVSVASPPAAKLRGTQAVNLGGGTSLLASAVRSGATSATPRQSLGEPRGTRLLSIGLCAEAPAVEEEPPALAARLEGGGASWVLNRKVTGIGQNPDVEIRLADPAVSGLHAQIVMHESSLFIRDMGGGSGTWVNGEPVTAARRLFDGDTIALGATRFVVRAPALTRARHTAHGAAERAPGIDVRSGSALGLRFALGTQPVVIGRLPDCTIRLDDMSVSRRHAVIEPAGGHYVLSDLGSRSGTFLRGAQLPQGTKVPLSEGDAIRIGSVDLVFSSIERAPAASVLRGSARIQVTSGAGSGQSLTFSERALIGSQPGCDLLLTGLSPMHAEIVAHGAGFWARDLSGGRTFRSGRPLGTDFVELDSGELLLLDQGTLLRFEEAS